MLRRFSTFRELTHSLNYCLPRDVWSKFRAFIVTSATQMDQLQLNPYYNKYAEKLKLLQKSSPETFDAKVSQLADAKKPSSQSRKKCGTESALEVSCEKLESVMKVELLQEKSPEDIAELACIKTSHYLTQMNVNVKLNVVADYSNAAGSSSITSSQSASPRKKPKTSAFASLHRSHNSAQSDNTALHDITCIHNIVEGREQGRLWNVLIGHVEANYLWNDYHKDKDYIFAVIPAAEYKDIHQKSSEFPTFIYPIPRGEGYEFFVQQWFGHVCHFTPLISYQTHRENAAACLSLIHFTELIDDKGVVLMRGEPDQRVLSVYESQLLALQIKMYYGIQSGLKYNYVRSFNNTPNSFSHSALIREFEYFKKDLKERGNPE